VRDVDSGGYFLTMRIAVVAGLSVLLLVWVGWWWLFGPAAADDWREGLPFDVRRPRDVVTAAVLVVGTAVGAFLYFGLKLLRALGGV
jgi:hypothetical protein